jgi:hypothetical protein
VGRSDWFNRQSYRHANEQDRNSSLVVRVRGGSHVVDDLNNRCCRLGLLVVVGRQQQQARAGAH